MTECGFKIGHCVVTRSYGHGTIYDIDKYLSRCLLHLKLDHRARAAVDCREATLCTKHQPEPVREATAGAAAPSSSEIGKEAPGSSAKEAGAAAGGAPARGDGEPDPEGRRDRVLSPGPKATDRGAAAGGAPARGDGEPDPEG